MVLPSSPLPPEKELYWLREAFSASDIETFTIPNGETGGSVAPVDLGAVYSEIRVWSPQSYGAYIQSSTGMASYVSGAADHAVSALYAANDPTSLWNPNSMPTTGFDFLLSSAAGIRYIQFMLSKTTQGALPIFVRGIGRRAE